MPVPLVRATPRGRAVAPIPFTEVTQGRSRARATIGMALAGAMTLSGALFAHELISFGAAGYGVIAPTGTPCTGVPCVTVGDILVGHAAKASGAMLIFGVVGALGLARWPTLALTVPLWIVLYLWSLVGIASGYRAAFGTGWEWWEPFSTLAWSPMLTPALMLGGLASFLALSRLARAA